MFPDHLQSRKIVFPYGTFDGNPRIPTNDKPNRTGLGGTDSKGKLKEPVWATELLG